MKNTSTIILFLLLAGTLQSQVIVGAAATCSNETNSVYSTVNIVGHTYNWSVSGGVITAGNGTNTITVNWGIPGIGTVDLTDTNNATGNFTAATQKGVTINALPTPVIVGAIDVCSGTTGSIFSVTNVAGHTYSWSVTGGAITAGNGTNSITVTWNVVGSGTVDVTETITATGCSKAASQKAITINPLPTPIITGSSTVCANETNSIYSTTSIVGHTYNWSVVDGVVTAGMGTNSITVTWGTTSSGTINLTETITSTGCSTTTQKVVTINELPTPVISGTTTVCANEFGTIFSVPSLGPPFMSGHSYIWTVVGGTVTAGAGTNAITVTWGAAGTGTVNLTETITATGCSNNAIQKNVIINALSTTIIDGATTVLSTAGSLNSLLSPYEKAMIHKLTITGTIDARDFKTLRDEMPLLEVLDMGGASIEAYNGTEGPGTNGTVYFANTIPNSAFYSWIPNTGKTTLTSVTLPIGLTKIDWEAFLNCSNLKSIYSANLIPPTVGSFAFQGIKSTIVYVPENGVSAYKAATDWSVFTISGPGINISTGAVSEQIYVPVYTPGAISSDQSSFAVFGFQLTADIIVTAPENFEISSSKGEAFVAQNPITLLPIGGTVNDTIYLRLKTGLATNNYSGNITLSSTGMTGQLIALTGAVRATPGTIHVASAGTLSTLLSATEKTAMTKITLTGTVDARDFKTLRDDMPILAEVDLSGVNIAAYTGNEGTMNYNPTYSYPFPANQLPQKAFSGYDQNTNTFPGKTTLSSVTLPNTATSIGGEAFYGCSGLKTITIPNSVLSIEYSAFSNCTVLTSAILGNGLTKIVEGAFSGCSQLANLSLPNSLITIKGGAFSGCVNLIGNLSIPSNVATIDDGAFIGCSNITEFQVSTENPNFSSLDGVLFNKDKTILYLYPEGKTGAYAIPNTVYSVNNFAFQSCTQLTTVSIPNSLYSFGDYSFYSFGNRSLSYHSGAGYFISCTSLTEINVQIDNPYYYSEYGVLFNKSKTNLLQYPGGKQGTFTLPNTISTVNNALYNCIGLTEINVQTGNSSFTSINGVLFDMGGARLVQYPAGKLGAYSIPNSVNWIGEMAFDNCNKLSSLTLPYSMSYVYGRYFNGCTSLTEFIVPTDHGSFTTVDGVLFSKDKGKLVQYPKGKQGAYSIPNTVTSIGDEAFIGCNGLTEITISSSVAAIGYGAFYDCTELKTIHSLNIAPPTMSPPFLPPMLNHFGGSTSIIDVFVPTFEAVTAYQANTFWQAYFPGTIIKLDTPTEMPSVMIQKVKVHTIKSKIIVEGSNVGDWVSLYTLSGIMLQTIHSQGEKMIFKVANNGVYIVKAGAKTYKILM